MALLSALHRSCLVSCSEGKLGCSAQFLQRNSSGKMKRQPQGVRNYSKDSAETPGEKSIYENVRGTLLDVMSHPKKSNTTKKRENPEIKDLSWNSGGSKDQH